VVPAVAIAPRGEPVGPHRRDPQAPEPPGHVRVCAIVDGVPEELEGDIALARLPALHASPTASFWVDLAGSTREQVMSVGTALGLHPLIVEDVLEGDQRAKIETTEGTLHIVLFHLDYDAEISTSEIDIVLAAGFLLTAHAPHWDPRASHHLRSGVEPVLRRGPDHLLWAIADDIVDAYFPFADRLGEDIDAVQDRVVQSAKPDVLEELFDLKRELIEVRRAISPVREVFNQLTNRDTPLVDEDEIVYFRDIYDHVIRLTDELDNYRELASATLDVYLSTVNNNLSVIMKRLTGVTVIIAGIGAIAGIFGMSEAGTALGGQEAGGFWLITMITIAIAAVAAVILRKIDWI
jgi:magnesium transporter